MKEYSIKNRQNYDGSAIKLMTLALVVYFISYFGRKSYDSNINEIMAHYGVGKSEAGLVGTFFFFIYAVGQVFHGIMCKHYNPRYTVAGAMVIAAACNLLIGMMPVSGFKFLKFVWLVNGFAMASLWSTLIRLFNRTFSKKRLKQSLVFMAFPVSIGTFLIYGASALFSFLNVYKCTFYVATGLLLCVGIIWFFSVDKLIYKSNIERLETDGESEKVINTKTGKTKIDSGFYVIFGVLAFFAIINNFVKDGLNTWAPTIFTEKYQLENWVSVLLTILLPLFAVLGANFAINLYKKIKNYISMCGILYVMATVVLVSLLLLLNLNSWITTLVCFVLVSAIMAGVNNVITNIFPLQVKNGIDAGLVAGLIDGFCYVGSAVAAFGLGTIAENMSWDTIMYLFTATCALCVLVVLGYFVVKTIKSSKT